MVDKSKHLLHARAPRKNLHKCPKCGKGLRDKIGVSHHLRDYHKLTKEQIREILNG